MTDKEQDEALVEEFLTRELTAEGYLKDGVYETRDWDYVVEITAHRVPKDKTVRLVE